MVDYTNTILYLGNKADADPLDGNGQPLVENQNVFLDTYQADLQLTTVTLSDNEGFAPGSAQDGSLHENVVYFNDGSIENPDSADRVSYDIGGGSVTTQLDAIMLADVTVTLAGGSTINISNLVITQMTNGDVFLNELPSQPGTLDNFDIVSIQVTSVSEPAGGFAAWFIPPDITNTDIVCFARGTLIKTDQGQVAVENLKVNDLVATVDAGFQPIRWLSCSVVDPIDLAVKPKLRPIRIRQGALGQGKPSQDLIVSRQHRVLVKSKIAMRMFDTDELLIPAVKLLELDGVEVVEDIDQVEYWHILLNDHHVIWSNDAPTESLYTGPEGIKALSPKARDEVLALFPELESPDYSPEPARFIPAGKQQKTLIARHIENSRQILMWSPELN